MQPFDVIDLSAIHIKKALLVDEYLQAVKFKYCVALVAEILVEAHPVLEAGATAANHLDAEPRIRLGLFGKNLLNLVFSFLGQHYWHYELLPSLQNYTLELL